MNKLKMITPDLTDKNIEQLGGLFPSVIIEMFDENGKVKKAIDFDLLRQILSKDLVDNDDERYRLDWPGKKGSLLKANTPITKTLRPCREESLHFEKTENLYIEGDNFEVLKILQESYLGKIKMIYIDPPYNTGNDFIYKDDYKKSKGEYEAEIGTTDEEGGKLFKNTDTNGRFHSDWLSMMYERLIVARDFLTDDGVIFISIDDNEVHNLRKICDEVFGEENFVSQIIWERAFAPISLKKHFSVNHDYVICFSRNLDNLQCYGLSRTKKANDRYSNPDNDPRGDWMSDNMTVGPVIEEKCYEIKLPSGRKLTPTNGRCWLYTREKYMQMVADNRIWFGTDGNNTPRVKKFLSEVKKGITPMTIWKHTEIGHSQDASQQLKKLFDGKDYFDYPKSVGLIGRCLELYSSSDTIILDFFSGSATTAHAVMKLNAEDGGNRKFIMVQLPELCDEKSEAFKAGYKTIAEIGKERIRRAGEKIVEELKEKNQKLDLGEEMVDPRKLDIGFRVYKTDSSNMKDVFYHPYDVDQEKLFSDENNIVEGRTSEDLLTQVMLELGLTLDLPIEIMNILGNTVYVVQTNALIACFDDNINFSIVEEIANLKPLRVVFKDASFEDDKDRINVEERFKRLSSETKVTVI